MSKKDDKTEESGSIVDEIEKQLEEALSKRKAEVEKELEERIQREREEAKKRLEEIDKELAEEKDALSNFKTLLAEFELSKSELKKQIKEHINKAIQFQTDIGTLTVQTLEELKTVRELNQQFEELQQDTGQKVTDLKDKLEEKFGIVAEVPETELDETDLNLEQELAKLKKIKELLNNREPIDLDIEEEVPEQAEGEEAPSEEPQDEAAPEEAAEMPEGEVSEEEMPGEQPADEMPEEPEEIVEEGAQPEEMKEEGEEQNTPETSDQQAEQPEEGGEAESETEAESPESAEETEGEKETEGEEEKSEGQGGKNFQDTFDRLESYRKGTSDENNGEVSYFEYNDKIVVDGEYLIATLNNSFEEAKKMYIKLSQTESPKDQFFIKQEIIKQQETLRKVMLRSIRLCEKDNCFLPEFTQEILNLDVLKTILEKVSMENWSNQDDFASFDNYAKQLKDSFYTRITPPAAYLESIMKQLEV